MKTKFILFFSFCIFLVISFYSCKDNNTKEETAESENTKCVPVKPVIDKRLHAKVLVVPANIKEYEYFQEKMKFYSYNSQKKDYGIRYSGKKRNNLIITLLKPGKTVDVKYGIIQLKGHTSDMDACFARVRQCVVPGRTIVISGGCESSQNMCKYSNLNIPAFTVNHIGQGPKNDYLVLQMQSLLQDYSYEETLEKLKENAPAVMSEYTYSE